MKNVIVKSLLTLATAASLSLATTGLAAPLVDQDGSYHSGDMVFSLETGQESIESVYIQAFQLGQLSEGAFFFDQSASVSSLKISSVKTSAGLTVSLDSATLMRPENGSTPLLRLYFDLIDGNDVTASYPVEVTLQNTKDGSSTTINFMVNVNASTPTPSNE
jgi:hypothetical protein